MHLRDYLAVEILLKAVITSTYQISSKGVTEEVFSENRSRTASATVMSITRNNLQDSKVTLFENLKYYMECHINSCPEFKNALFLDNCGDGACSSNKRAGRRFLFKY